MVEGDTAVDRNVEAESGGKGSETDSSCELPSAGESDEARAAAEVYLSKVVDQIKPRGLNRSGGFECRSDKELELLLLKQ